jgi:UDPglucose 6-dehydrogenase
MTKIAVVGLGKLGACTAACFAYRGYEVIGVDVDKTKVDLINAGIAPVVEPRLQEFITAAGKRLRATQDFEDAFCHADITFLITPSPSELDGHFSDQYISAAIEPLAMSLKKSHQAYHLFVITSTISPGTTIERLIPLIEEMSGRKLKRGFGVCYNPEFIALGTVIHDFLHPDLVLIGESDRRAGDQLVELYRHVCENQPHIARMSITSAEITKISLNAYVTMKISFANTLANLCEKIPEADIDAITTALGADKRISPYYLKGGLAFGGPCFPRDNKAFIAFAKKYGCEAKLAEASDMVNEYQVEHLADLVLQHLSSGKDRNVSILGLAYKVNTPIIEESAAVKLISQLLMEGVKITVYDPLAMAEAKALFRESVAYADSVRDCTSRSSLWVITTPASEFKAVDDSHISHNPITIIDCWRTIDSSIFRKAVNYVAVGRSCGWTS